MYMYITKYIKYDMTTSSKLKKNVGSFYTERCNFKYRTKLKDVVCRPHRPIGPKKEHILVPQSLGRWIKTCCIVLILSETLIFDI